jgi:alpha-2-macroglobulin
MFTSKLNRSWILGLLVLLLSFAAGVIAIAIEKPVGTISGKIALEEEGFNLSTYNIRENKVYALAIGPRGGDIVERGVWVNPDGTFQISQLPVGEYDLRIRATGFSSTDQQGIFVDEAKVTQLPDPIHLAIHQPSVNIASNSRVFTSKEQPHFWLNASGSIQASVKIYRTDILSLLAKSKHDDTLDFSSDLSIYKPYQKNVPKFLIKEKPIQVLTRKLNSDREDWSHTEFKLDKPLPAGEYVLIAEVSNLKKDTDWNLMWFSVSDLGLIVKQAPEKTLVRAINLNTLQPISGVNVQLKDRSNPGKPAMRAGITGQDGMITLAAKSHENNYLLVLGQKGASRAFGGIDYWNDNSDGYQTYFYTERPIYRLGQTVYFKGLTRLQTPDGFKTPKAGLPLSVTVEDPDNNTLWKGKLTANAHGTFHGTYEIPKNGKTGAYQISVSYPDGTDSYHRFEVAQYRKPEYQVDVVPLTQRIIAGNKAKARIRANYYFGAPVANARVKYSIYADTDWSGRYQLMPRPAYYSYYDDWDSDEESYYSSQSYAGAYITEGYAQTDASGEALIEFDTPPVTINRDEPYGSDYLDKRYTIQAEVTDLSRIAVVGSGTQAVSAGDFTLYVQPENYVSKAGSPIKATISAVDYHGKAVPNRSVTVSMLRWNWDRVKAAYRGKTIVATTTITTDANGKAALTLPTTDQYFTDGYHITAETRDDAGHIIYAEEGIWIASENYPYIRDGQATQQEAFSIKLDKAAYQPGETARAMITAPVSGKEHADVILAIEGAKLHDVRLIPMDATAKMVEIPLKDNYTPNVYVTATLVGPKHQFYSQSEIIKVSPANHFLNINVKTDKSKYKPGETAVYTIEAKYPDGKPARDTELSLGVVDESIYAIRPEAARDIRKFFYNRIYNAVSTFSSFPEEYSGGPDKVEPRVRKDFRDMAAWLPNLVTDAQGIATAKVKLPDNLTTWRATVRGINLQTDVGSAVAKIIATQDMIVRLALPRFFTQYDRGYLTAIVHNYTEKPQKVTLTLAPSSQFSLKESLVQELTVKPDGAERYGWPVDIQHPGEGIVNIKAIGETSGDAMEMRIPIRPLGIEMTEAVSGILKTEKDSIELPFKIPTGTSPELARILLSVSASSLGPVLGSFDSLIDYPYGCTEQTMSRLVPAAIAMQLNKKLGIPIEAGLRKRFDEVAVQALAKLKDYHHVDGGWGWWKYDESNPYMTAYVLDGMNLLREAGYPVGEDSLPYNWQQDGVKYLSDAATQLVQQLDDPKIASDKELQMDRLIDLAYMQYVLSLYDAKPAKTVRNFILRRASSAAPEVLGFSTLAFKRTHDDTAAKTTYAALNRLADPASGMLNWDHTVRLHKLLGLRYPEYTYRFTGVEATALALRAAVTMEGQPLSDLSNHRLEAIERWLILQRNKDGWDNTKTTATVLRAMMEKAIAQQAPGGTQFTAHSTLWQAAKSFSQDNLYGPEQTTSAPYNSLNGQPLLLSKEGPGRLYYRSLLNYVQVLKPGESFRHTALPEGLQIQRSFYRIQPEQVGPQGTLRFKTHSIPDHKVRAGETILMKVTMQAPVALPYIIVDATLPSGGEVVSDDPRESLIERPADSDTNVISGDWGSWWWSHQDILDDRVVMFVTSLPAGKSEFYALVRMELPGTFQMNPVKLEGMYSKAIHAYSGLDQLEVTD